MSNALAIATVTQSLALLIENNLRPEIDMAVSVEARKPPAEPPTEPTITVFLYQVTPNPSLPQYDLPTRASDGTLLKRPAAALDLHYVISAYGEETELVGQRLIGCVVRTLHEVPVLPKDVIEEAAHRPFLDGSDLAESLQKVRFTPTQMDVDETSKLWGMLHQTPYSLSVAYQASLVLIDGREEPVPARPVRERTVRVAPFGAPGAPQRPPAYGEPGPAQGAARGREADQATEAAPGSVTRSAGARDGRDGAARRRADAPTGGPSQGAASTTKRPAAKTAPAKSPSKTATSASAPADPATSSGSPAKRASSAGSAAHDEGDRADAARPGGRGAASRKRAAAKSPSAPTRSGKRSATQAKRAAMSDEDSATAGGGAPAADRVAAADDGATDTVATDGGAANAKDS